MVINDGSRFPRGDGYSEALGGPKEVAYVPAEVKAGTLVLIHGNLLHKSEKNLSHKGRMERRTTKGTGCSHPRMGSRDCARPNRKMQITLRA